MASAACSSAHKALRLAFERMDRHQDALVENDEIIQKEMEQATEFQISELRGIAWAMATVGDRKLQLSPTRVTASGNSLQGG